MTGPRLGMLKWHSRGIQHYLQSILQPAITIPMTSPRASLTNGKKKHSKANRWPIPQLTAKDTEDQHWTNMDEERSHHGYLLCDSITMSDRKRSVRSANAIASWQYGIPLIVDMWYDQSHHNLDSLISALRDLILTNIDSNEPFFIHFTDIQIGSQSEKAIRHLLNNNEDYLQAFHTRSCVELFPKSHLMYLTPYSLKFWNVEFKQFINHIPVIGGLIDGPYTRLSPNRIRQLGVSARCLYYTHEIRKKTAQGSVLSLANSLQTLHELKAGKPVRYTAELFRRWAYEERVKNRSSQPYRQSLFEY